MSEQFSEKRDNAGLSNSLSTAESGFQRTDLTFQTSFENYFLPTPSAPFRLESPSTACGV
jgi:hypothetical protein